jgi:hypothetical protein
VWCEGGCCSPMESKRMHPGKEAGRCGQITWPGPQAEQWGPPPAAKSGVGILMGGRHMVSCTCWTGTTEAQVRASAPGNTPPPPQTLVVELLTVCPSL